MIRPILAVMIPYAAALIFLIGIVRKVLQWASSPVPFRIPATCGQQKSLSWIKSSRLDNPHSTLGVIGRMALEVLLFRSLFRNTRAELRTGPQIVFDSSKWLWLGALAFHWSLLIILLRHLRFFIEPEPVAVSLMHNLDGFFQAGMPVILASDIIFAVALAFLFLRRILIPRLRYICLASDYIPLLLFGGIAATGILMRHFYKTDLRMIKDLAISLISLKPMVPADMSTLFYIHLFLVSCLIAYFPFSKLMHMGGVFLSPTRNLANNNRRRRHMNPWNYPVKAHTYEEYEDEFRPLMIEAGLPVERKEPAQTGKTEL
jgi:nitrate reductase gamma subunit